MRTRDDGNILDHQEIGSFPVTPADVNDPRSRFAAIIAIHSFSFGLHRLSQSFAAVPLYVRKSYAFSGDLFSLRGYAAAHFQTQLMAIYLVRSGGMAAMILPDFR